MLGWVLLHDAHSSASRLSPRCFKIPVRNNGFNEFTEEIVGLRLGDKYQLSKGKSLECYLAEAPRADAIKLLEALMKEWLLTSPNTISDEEFELSTRCFEQLNNLKANLIPVELRGDSLVEAGFSSEYLDNQRELLTDGVRNNPTLAIGISKEMVESCARTILVERGGNFSRKDDMPKLVRKAMASLGINANDVDPEILESQTVEVLLSNLAQTSNSLVELRNSFGTGHGKEENYKGLSERHARLSAGVALTLTQYLWNTHLLSLSQK